MVKIHCLNLIFEQTRIGPMRTRESLFHESHKYGMDVLSQSSNVYLQPQRGQ